METKKLIFFSIGLILILVLSLPAAARAGAGVSLFTNQIGDPVYYGARGNLVLPGQFSDYGLSGEILFDGAGIASWSALGIYRILLEKDIGYDLFLEAGMSYLEKRDPRERLTGPQAGISAIRDVNSAWDAFTRIRLGFYPDVVNIDYNFGFIYSFSEYLNFSISYHGYTEADSGLELGVGLKF